MVEKKKEDYEGLVLVDWPLYVILICYALQYLKYVLDDVPEFLPSLSHLTHPL